MAPAAGLLAAAVLAAVASLAAHVAVNCPIEPAPSPPAPASHYPPNNLLQRLEKLGEGLLDAPEDVHVDAAAGGALYTATRDGWLQRMRPAGNGSSWERWRFVGGTGLLGITPSADGTMLVCDADKGLLRVGEDGEVTLLASEVDGTAIRFRCTKVWLKGEKSGQAETFIDNLPGAPDNIRLGSDGSFWIALLPVRSPWLDVVYRWTVTRRVVASFPALLEWSKATAKGAMVAQVSEAGEILRLLDDSEGKVINFVTSVTEYNGDLFLGSLATNFVGKLSLAQVTQELDAVSS